MRTSRKRHLVGETSLTFTGLVLSIPRTLGNAELRATQTPATDARSLWIFFLPNGVEPAEHERFHPGPPPPLILFIRHGIDSARDVITTWRNPDHDLRAESGGSRHMSRAVFNQPWLRLAVARSRHAPTATRLASSCPLHHPYSHSSSRSLAPTRKPSSRPHFRRGAAVIVAWHLSCADGTSGICLGKVTQLEHATVRFRSLDLFVVSVRREY